MIVPHSTTFLQPHPQLILNHKAKQNKQTKKKIRLAKFSVTQPLGIIQAARENMPLHFHLLPYLVPFGKFPTNVPLLFTGLK